MPNNINKPIEILSPKIDIIFKLLFGDIRNIEILVDFLKSVLYLPDAEYEAITITDPNLKRETLGDKSSILDVRLSTKTGKIVHIEIQVLKQAEMPERITYYNAKALVTQINSGQNYDELEKTISIIITDFDMIPNSPRYHHVFQLIDKQSGVMLTDLIEINTLELTKTPDKSDNTQKYQWLSFLKSESKEEFEMIAEKNPVIQKAFAELKRLSLDEEAQMLYEAREKAIRDENSRLKFALKQGKAEGKIEGNIEGKIEVAKKSFEIGLSIEQISEITGLTIDELRKI